MTSASENAFPPRPQDKTLCLIDVLAQAHAHIPRRVELFLRSISLFVCLRALNALLDSVLYYIVLRTGRLTTRERTTHAGAATTAAAAVATVYGPVAFSKT